jgi:hypothetical protein
MSAQLDCMDSGQSRKYSCTQVAYPSATITTTVTQGIVHPPALTDAAPISSRLVFTEIKYIIYKLDNPSRPTKITVGKDSESQSYDDFLEEFSDTECCYAVYDFQYNLGEGERNKICFFIWCVIVRLQ